ncbi:MAG: ABC transporter permease [Ahrensia sp.]|nr:ABC transporter permease [Ahrensia sp.]
MEVWVSILLSICAASTPLLLAATGELVVERSGVLNLGVEGMMIIGAVTAFSVAQASGSVYGGAGAAIFAGAAFSLLFAFLTLTLVANQVATGLALTILGLGLSGMIGESFVGLPGLKLDAVAIPGLSGLPVVGPFFNQDPLFYTSIVLVVAVAWFLFQTKAGLTLRAVGDSHDSAHALGINVIAVRYFAIMFGGACAGLAGAYLSLVVVPQWTEGMTAGRGWIALALVVFASWRPWRVLLGAYLFGAITIAQFHAQATDASEFSHLPQWLFAIIAWATSLPAQFLTSLPYLATIVVLVLIAGNRRLTMINTPASLGKSFVPDR